MRLYKSVLFPMVFNFLAVASFKTGLISCLTAQPSHIHLSLSIAAKQEAAAPVTITWCSDKSPGKQFIKYGLTSDPTKLMKARKTEFSDKVIFNAHLTKLKGGAKYFYRCGSDKAGWSRLYEFYSEPDTGTFRVGIIGDTQNNQNNEAFQKTKAITDQLKAYSPSLTLHMGDIVDNGSITESWCDFLKVTQDLNAISPLMPVLGNHDVRNIKGDDFQEPFPAFHSLFSLPGDEVNYAFTYMKVRFIGIFSGYAQAAAETGQVKYKPGSPEYKWLDAELSKAEKDENINWIIVCMHYPVISYGWSNISGWKDNVLPLLERHKVDLCLAGHRHVYERHFQIKDGVPVKNDSVGPFLAGNGTIFITNPTAGGNPTGPGGKDMPSVAFTPDKISYGFGIIDINDKSMTYRVFDQENTLIDRFSVIKIPGKSE